MNRLRRRSTRSPLRGAAFVALALTAALAAAACNSEPAAPELTDPTEILQAAATETASATSFHLDVAADGQFSLDLTGTGVGAPLSLGDSTATADVDIAGGDARLTFALPGILGLRGELVAVDGTAWVKTSATGPNYREVPLGGTAPTDPGASSDPGMLDALGDFLAQPGIDPVKGEDVECGTTSCYVIEIDLTAAELIALGSDGAELPIPSALPIPLPDLTDSGFDLTIRVEKATRHLAGLTAIVTAGEVGAATVEVTFSKWNEPVSITPPPADQIESGGPVP